ncbi:hypothetical protein [Hugenholtzia roseola]|uniref:hypothetical protein n=1 Tax=Hugenholtzia roseola TaxID=1002 RepID=UPI00047C9060|nr:hypothetical protein [Hugenholtzia roseola]
MSSLKFIISTALLFEGLVFTSMAQVSEVKRRHQFSFYYNRSQPLGKFNRQQQGRIEGVELNLLKWIGKKDPNDPIWIGLQVGYYTLSQNRENFSGNMSVIAPNGSVIGAFPADLDLHVVNSLISLMAQMRITSAQFDYRQRQKLCPYFDFKLGYAFLATNVAVTDKAQNPFLQDSPQLVGEVSGVHLDSGLQAYFGLGLTRRVWKVVNFSIGGGLYHTAKIDYYSGRESNFWVARNTSSRFESQQMTDYQNLALRNLAAPSSSRFNRLTANVGLTLDF